MWKLEGNIFQGLISSKFTDWLRMCYVVAGGPKYQHDVYGADNWTDTISTESQFRKFMDRHCAESGMIRKPQIYSLIGV